MTTYGVAVRRPVRIELRARHPAGLGHGGYTGNHRIVIYATSDNGSPVNDYSLRRAAIHELFHVLQQELSGSADLDDGPEWLVEGGARLTEDLAVYPNASPRDAGLRCILLDEVNVHGAPPLPVLQNTVSMQNSGSSGYALAALAAKQAIADRGAAALGVYYRGLAPGDWQTAFVRAFGVQPDRFYEEFARARTRDWPAESTACNADRDDDE